MADTEQGAVAVVWSLSLAAQKLIDLLSKGKVGDVLTDDVLEKECGRNCQPGHKGYGALQTAMRRVRRASGLHWRRIEGSHTIRCLNASEVLAVSDSRRKKINRAATRTLEELAGIQPDQLSTSEKAQYGANVAAIGTVKLMSSTDTRKRLEQSRVPATFDSSRILPLFCDGTT